MGPAVLSAGALLHDESAGGFHLHLNPANAIDDELEWLSFPWPPPGCPKSAWGFVYELRWIPDGSGYRWPPRRDAVLGGPVGKLDKKWSALPKWRKVYKRFLRCWKKAFCSEKKKDVCAREKNMDMQIEAFYLKPCFPLTPKRTIWTIPSTER